MGNMEWIQRLNQTIGYIEENITGEIDYGTLAKTACCSSYHFQRMFAYLAGVPLSEYIRRRKMSLAAVELQNGGQRVLDIALKYGYASPTAFNRAFQGVHGVPPSMIKQPGVPLKSYPPMHFKIIVTGVNELNFRLEKKEAFRVLGVSAPLDRDFEKSFVSVPLMWQKAGESGTLRKLAGMIGPSPAGILGVSACGDFDNPRYYIAVAAQTEDDTLEAYAIPAYTWAIFPGEGACPEAMQALQKRIITEWLPTSGYEYASGPDIEVYLTPDMREATFEAWLPVVRKA